MATWIYARHLTEAQLNKLYGWLAGLVAVLAVVGVIYGKGRLDAAHKSEMAGLRHDLTVAQETLDKEKNAREQDAILATEQSKRQAALTLKINGLETYVASLQDGNRECLDARDTDRLRDLWDR